MSLQASGTSLSASQIRSEFGATSGTSVSFGAYKVSQTISGLTDMPLDEGIPQSGTIKFSDFYSKELNVVVNYTVGVGTTTRVNGRSDYDANNSKVVVIGNFRQRPVSPVGTKVWIHTNGDIGSDKTGTSANDIKYCSLITGTWTPTTDLRLDIGPNGRVVGAGGDGGDGGGTQGGNRNAEPFPGNSGSTGTSAIGINTTSILITNRGTIQSGGGGGGGGGGAIAINKNTGSPDRIRPSGGGGGGGGIGYPGGKGGSGGICNGGDPNNGVDGTSGITSLSGNGGAGGSVGTQQGQSGASLGGGGGGGGTSGLGGDTPNGTNDGTVGTTIKGGDGGDGSANGFGSGGTSKEAPGAVGGADGYAIVVNNDGTGVTIQNTGTFHGVSFTGTIVGVTTYSTIPV